MSRTLCHPGTCDGYLMFVADGASQRNTCSTIAPWIRQRYSKKIA